MRLTSALRLTPRLLIWPRSQLALRAGLFTSSASYGLSLLLVQTVIEIENA